MTYSGREYGVCLFFSIHTDDNNYPFTAVSVKHWCSDPLPVRLSVCPVGHAVKVTQQEQHRRGRRMCRPCCPRASTLVRLEISLV